MCAGVAYGFQDGDRVEVIRIGSSKTQKAVVFNSSNAIEARERNRFGDSFKRLWKICIFDMCGVKNVHRKNLSPIIISALEQREQLLEETAEIIKKEFPRLATDTSEMGPP